MDVGVTVTTEVLPVSFLTSVRYYWRDTTPRTHSWPLFRLTLSEQGLVLEPAVGLPVVRRGPHLDVPWRDVAKIERTRRGVRLVFAGERKPVVVATWRHERLVQTIKALCPVEFDPTLRRSTWTTV